MNDDQPTQPLTDAELSAIRALWGDILSSNTEETSFGASMVPADVHLFDLKFAKVLAEVDRLRVENAQLRRNAELASDGAPKTTPTSGIVVNFEPGAPMSSTDNFAIGFSAGLRRGSQGR